jgi:hypothetical protein
MNQKRPSRGSLEGETASISIFIYSFEARLNLPKPGHILVNPYVLSLRRVRRDFQTTRHRGRGALKKNDSDPSSGGMLIRLFSDLGIVSGSFPMRIEDDIDLINSLRLQTRDRIAPQRQ